MTEHILNIAGLLLCAVIMALAVIVIIGIAYYAFRDVKKQEKAYMDNSEFDWGYNVKHRTEEDYE